MNYYQPQQPVYGNYNPYQYQQPQYDRLNNLMQYQQNLQPQQTQNFINGKVVDSLEVVKATDVPMDGQAYYFPKADGTEIYCKKWNANGTTSITSYKPYLEPNTENPIESMPTVDKIDYGALQSVTDDIMKRIDDRFDKLEKSFANVRKISAKVKECDVE